jgi:hypothetical protein
VVKKDSGSSAATIVGDFQGRGQLGVEVGRREGEFIGEHSPVYNVGGDQQRSDSNRGALN